MLQDVVAVKHVGSHRLRLCFEDGMEGEIDLDDIIRFSGVFAPLIAETEFAKVRVDAESGTIVWPNGADVDPDVLYAAVSGTPVDLPDNSRR